MRVFVTGGTGLVGTRLVSRLLARGDQPVVLTRRFGPARQLLGPKVDLVEGDPTQPGAWTDQLATCDGVIHLAGENVFAKRWNSAFEQQLVDSRIHSTRRIAEALVMQPMRSDGQPKILVNASAIGYYGPHGDEELTEASPPGNDFLAKLCVDWEKEARVPESAGVRCCQIRVGVVLDKTGGALAKLLPPFKMFAGGPVGSGKQYMSWIHNEDLVGLFLLGLTNADATGPINGTAPNPLTNKEFGNALGKALGRPSFFWTPGFLLKAGLGKAAEIILNGQRVLPKRAQELGFVFQYPTLDAALANLLT